MAYLKISLCSEYHPFPAGTTELFSSVDAYNPMARYLPILQKTPIS